MVIVQKTDRILISFRDAISIEDVLRAADAVNDLFDTADGVLKPIVVSLDSPGGTLNPAMEFVRGMIGLGAEQKVTTFARRAGSAAAAIFLSGKERVVHPQGRLLFHGVTIKTGIWELDPQGRVPRSRIDLAWALHNELVDLLGQRTTLPKEQIVRMMQSSAGRYFSAEEALRCGIATAIGDIDSPPASSV